MVSQIHLCPLADAAETGWFFFVYWPEYLQDNRGQPGLYAYTIIEECPQQNLTIIEEFPQQNLNAKHTHTHTKLQQMQKGKSTNFLTTLNTGAQNKSDSRLLTDTQDRYVSTQMKQFVNCVQEKKSLSVNSVISHKHGGVAVNPLQLFLVAFLSQLYLHPKGQETKKEDTQYRKNTFCDFFPNWVIFKQFGGSSCTHHEFLWIYHCSDVEFGVEKIESGVSARFL